ncbi:hypothetical protein KKH38_00715 [Patescibacteria group bacterium]|nr:hypothetical protein [Patescibacteria group bacterium]MBU4600982.1 hypothetical protein [Patescibacteria group bacterium]MCG2697606.1 hypothetical protein [Candidatus Parcubacteria bacterium]
MQKTQRKERRKKDEKKEDVKKLFYGRVVLSVLISNDAKSMGWHNKQ